MECRVARHCYLLHCLVYSTWRMGMKAIDKFMLERRLKMFMKKKGIDPTPEALAIWMAFAVREIDNAKREAFNLWSR